MAVSDVLGDIQRQLSEISHSQGRLEGKVETFIGQLGLHNERMDGLERRTTAALKDHEDRLRSGEKWRWAHVIPLAGLTAFAAKLGLPIPFNH